GTGSVGAQDPLAAGTVLNRTVLTGAEKLEAILVLREVPPGEASGWHTQSDTEIVYIIEGSVILEVKGKEAVTVKAGEAFTTSAGDVHNVKNASSSAPVKAAAFYIAKKGAQLEDLSVPAE
ncbi:MAG: cupin domain-containing protein, partial [Acidobacteriota bacterium]|nr:cupin domain-containing protein [Acidobacteriota bacterium]